MVHAAGENRHPLFWPYLFSFVGHLLLFAFILYTPRPDSDESLFPSIIDVQIVDVQTSAPSVQKSKAPKEAPSSAIAEEAPVEAKTPSKPPVKSTAEAEVSVAPPQPKSKTALKYKTMKSQKVLKSTLKRLEEKVQTAPPKPLEDTIKRLREKVEKEGRPEKNEAAGNGEAVSVGQKKGFKGGGKQEGELIDMYRLEIAYAIQKNWAYSEQLAGNSGDLVASIVMKVMPDGQIEDIFFTDRSGNPYLDESAYKAIVKTSPVKPHPDTLNRPYIEMGLRFTPKGVQ